MPTRLCAGDPTCNQPAVYRGRCKTHATQRNRETRSRNTKVYSSKRWKQTRKHKLSITPLCEHDGCERIAEDVHHRTAIEAGGPVWAMSNLEALCHSHHSQVTRREQLSATR